MDWKEIRPRTRSRQCSGDPSARLERGDAAEPQLRWSQQPAAENLSCRRNHRPEPAGAIGETTVSRKSHHGFRLFTRRELPAEVAWEQGSEAGITAAAAVSVPFDLSLCTDRMNRGFSRVYQKHFVDLLKASARRKFSSLPPLFDVGNIEEIRTLRNLTTGSRHRCRFKNAEDYYSKSSCKAFLKTIRVPTLIMNSLDDPFLEVSSFPSSSEVSRRWNWNITGRRSCGFHHRFPLEQIRLDGNQSP